MMGIFDDPIVPARENQTILDVVTEIQHQQDASLSYRFACRVGVCGSCAMTVNGRARWTCRTHVRSLKTDQITIEPLSNMPKIKDLAADMSGFIDKWGQAGNNSALIYPAMMRLRKLTLNRRSAKWPMMRLNVSIAGYAMRLVMSKWNDDYLGSAALNRAWSLVNDIRHNNTAETLAAALGPGVFELPQPRQLHVGLPHWFVANTVYRRAEENEPSGHVLGQAMTEARLYALQRLSAVVMPLVVVHLITIMIAVQNGLTAEEILARTQGFSIWGVFYTIFVLAVAIHAPLGLRKNSGGMV